MNYRHPAGFFCTAEKLLELILMDSCIIFEEHKEYLIFVVRDIYGDLHLSPSQMLFEMLSYPFDDRVAQIVAFGRENGISMQDWFLAIEH